MTANDTTAGHTTPAIDRSVLPIPQAPFAGTIGLRAQESVASFPHNVTAPEGAPNVVLILLDDVGFGATSTFGGPINTPTVQKVADEGLRYNRFHTTALCSPTRAAMITGRNHHTAHTGVVMEMSTGFPGYDSVLGRDMVTVAEILKLNGYNTAWIGKDHNVSDWESSQAGPFDRWPTGLGFEKFYGFLGGEANNWRPAMFDGTTPIEPSLGNPDYHLDFDLADQAISWIRMQQTVAPDKPFFALLRTGRHPRAQHAKPEWAAKYKGRFDAGWDAMREEIFLRQKELGVIPADAKLTPRPESVPVGDSGTPEEQGLWAHMMEIAAGYMEQCDYDLGRVLQAIEDIDQADNTLVIYIVGDNGAAGEGTLKGAFNDIAILSAVEESIEYLLSRKDDMGTWKSSPLYPVPWAWAMNSPFQWTKQVASHFGGTRNAMVMSWPKGITDRGGLREQFHHVIDIVPTILEAAGIPQPVMVNGEKQHPIEGVSMNYTFDDPDADGRRITQYFEIFGNAAVYHDGWLAGTTPERLPWEPNATNMDVLTANWELYNLEKDFSQADDLAAEMPEKVKEMQVRFYAEAAKFNVLPIDSSAVERFGDTHRPSLTGDRTTFTYFKGMKRIPEGAAPNVKNRSWSLSTAVTVTEVGHDSGVIATQGGLFGGWALYVMDGKPVFSYTFADGSNYRFASDSAIPLGTHDLVMEFVYDGGGLGKSGTATVLVDGDVYTSGRVLKTTPHRFSTEETLDIGVDTGTPVDMSYDIPFAYTGTLGKVVIELK